MEPSGYLAIGKIIGLHGIKGNLKVLSYAESLAVFEAGESLYIRHPEAGGKAHSIKWAKPYKKGVLLSLNDVDDRDQAQTLIGAELFIDKDGLPQTEEDTWYWFDLIGLKVFTLDQAYLGEIKNVFQTGSNDVFEVQDPAKPDKTEILIPALKSVVVEIDLELRTMRVDLPEELF